MPLPCSPVSMSTGEDTSQSHSATGSDSEDSLITPRPGPSNPEHRTVANLSRPAKISADAFRAAETYGEWKTDNSRERPELSSAVDDTDEQEELDNEDFGKAGRKQTMSQIRGGLDVKVDMATSNEEGTGKQEFGKRDGGIAKGLKAEETGKDAKGLGITEASATASSKAEPEKETPGDGRPERSFSFTSPSTCSPPRSLQHQASTQSQRQSLPKDIKDSSGAARHVAPPSTSTTAASNTPRGVSFHPSSYPRPSSPSYNSYMNRRVSQSLSPYGTSRVSSSGGGMEETESSADENTAIFRRTSASKTGVGTYGSTGRGDDGADAAAAYDGAGEEEGGAERPLSVHALESPPGAVKRRKSSLSKVSGGGSKSQRAASGSSGRQAGSANLPLTDDHDESGDDEERDGWWKVFVEKYGSVELENKGSVARDHLALERTFLAWLRTSLSFASIGIAVTQLFRLNTSLANNQTTSLYPASSSLDSDQARILADVHRLRQVGKPLGATFLGIAILILLLGFHRYFESQHYVIRGKFPASRGSIVIVSVVACALIVASLVVVVSVAPAAFEKR